MKLPLWWQLGIETLLRISTIIHTLLIHSRLHDLLDRDASLGNKNWLKCFENICSFWFLYWCNRNFKCIPSEEPIKLSIAFGIQVRQLAIMFLGQKQTISVSLHFHICWKMRSSIYFLFKCLSVSEKKCAFACDPLWLCPIFVNIGVACKLLLAD